MSLSYNLSKCDPAACFDGEGDDRTLSVTAEAMIWTTLAVEIGNWTEADLPEVAWRINFLARVGKGVVRKADDAAYTVSDLRPFVGLSTNVAKRTRKQWLKSITDALERDQDASERIRNANDRAGIAVA